MSEPIMYGKIAKAIITWAMGTKLLWIKYRIIRKITGQ